MVNLLYSLLLLFAFCAVADDVRFETECSKPRIYTGEAVSCSYILYAPIDLLDVEVAKFPEYRGFWSENLSLRQGPIPLNQGVVGGLHRGSVGSYLITSMVGRTDSSIEPMKVSIRKPGAPDMTGATLASNPPKLQIIPLPPVPPPFNPEFFKGAVGRFSAFSDTHEIPFEKDEPTILRVSLSGEGNFTEINALYLPLPESVEILSRRSSSQGNGQFLNKTFEISIAVHTDHGFEVGAIPFVYFNPVDGCYEQLTLPKLTFRFVPTPPLRFADLADEVELPALSTRWTNYRPWYRSTGIAAAECSLLLALLFLMGFRAWEKKRLREKSTPVFQQKLKCDIALHSLQTGNIEHFLKLADEIAYEYLARSLALPPHTTRERAIRLAKNRLPTETVIYAENIFAGYHRLAYSRAKAQPVDLESMPARLSKMVV